MLLFFIDAYAESILPEVLSNGDGEDEGWDQNIRELIKLLEGSDSKDAIVTIYNVIACAKAIIDYK